MSAFLFKLLKKRCWWTLHTRHPHTMGTGTRPPSSVIAADAAVVVDDDAVVVVSCGALHLDTTKEGERGGGFRTTLNECYCSSLEQDPSGETDME